MQLIQTVTVGATPASEILFSSIPATFTDLFLQVSLRSTRNTVADDIVFRFNGDTAANYAFRGLLGLGSGSGSSFSNGSASLCYLGLCSGSASPSNTFGNQSIYIPNYRASTAKSASVDSVSENNATEAYQVIIANRWSGTAAINAIRIFSDTGNNFAQHSSASLYGITAGSSGGVVVS